MTRTPIDSSWIKSIGHDGDNLEVELANGDVHTHQGVPPDVHQAMMSSDSIGRFYNSRIKGAYPSTKA